MTRSDLDRMPVRVVEPDGRVSARTRVDIALRILEFDSPRHHDSPLSLHTGFSIVSGLSRQAKAAVIASVDALCDKTPEVGLGGTIVADGTVHPMHADLDAPTHPPLALDADVLDITFTEPGRLHELVEAIESALLLAEAELRGADESRRALLRVELDVPEVIDLRPPRADAAEIEETLEALDAIVPDNAVIDELQRLLVELDRIAEPSDESKHVERLTHELDGLAAGADDQQRAHLEAALDDAVEARNSLDRRRTSTAYELVDVLGSIGVRADHDHATDVARRVVDEQADLEQIRSRLLAKLGEQRPQPRIHEPSAELAAIEARLVTLRRRQQTQRHLLRAAQEAVSLAEGQGEGRTVLGPMADDVRPLPLLLVEPLADLPPELGPDVLSILLRVSEVHQVICLSESPSVHAWADDVGGRVGHIEAAGWFAGDPA